jgi:hypothetical protein
VKPRTGATIGCRSISRDPPFGWRRRLPPPPPKPRTGDEAGGAGSNRTSIPGRGHDTTALSWTQCQSFLDNIIAGFQPNLFSVTPSGAALTTASVPILLPTPGRFSMMNWIMKLHRVRERLKQGAMMIRSTSPIPCFLTVLTSAAGAQGLGIDPNSHRPAFPFPYREHECGHV